jgi:predicted N-acetyltransferase YhbS
MPDMLVPLYRLPQLDLTELEASGFAVRRPLAYERPQIYSWIEKNFSRNWAEECGVCFGRTPISAFIAVNGREMVGFAAYDAACRNFFGPTGVHPAVRGKGVGRSLLLAALHAMRSDGYAYAIIGGVGPADFYSRTVGAILIDGSTPGIYRDSVT